MSFTSNLPDPACPHCGSSASIKLYGSYERNYIEYRDGMVCYRRIRVRRIFCRNCGRACSVLPDSLPYHGQYCMDFIKAVLSEYDSGFLTVQAICGRYQITPAMLYRWKKKYPAT